MTFMRGQLPRVARDPEIDFVSLMTEMATYGLGELANEAADLLEQGGEVKAGSARLQVHPAQWSGDGPGRGAVDVDGHQWHFHGLQGGGLYDRGVGRNPALIRAKPGKEAVCHFEFGCSTVQEEKWEMAFNEGGSRAGPEVAT